MVLWFTGLSGSGKSTVAGALEEALHERGVSTYLLDGDNVRHGLCSDLGFSDEDRKENIRRVGEVARLMVDAGLVVLTAFISPHRAERQMVRERLGEGRLSKCSSIPAGHLRGAGSERDCGEESAGRGITQFHRYRLGL